jgi:hypothetical protein
MRSSFSGLLTLVESATCAWARQGTVALTRMRRLCEAALLDENGIALDGTLKTVATL